MTISTKLSAYGLNMQHNCFDEIMSGTSFSDPQEGQVLARIYQIGQTRSNRARKLVVENNFMQVRMNKRFHKFAPDLMAYMAQEDDIAESDVKDLAEISNLDDADSAEKIEDAVEKMREVEGVAMFCYLWFGVEYGRLGIWAAWNMGGLEYGRLGIWAAWVWSFLLSKWLSSCELPGG
ncbi:hypothetical protein EAF00_002904 [Botryotinia globosa]|nr:hypothetical protein EAF00_002904 [Botryotinia globosa]